MAAVETVADPILQANEVIRAASPALWDALSPLGRRAQQPAAFLPLQTAEARGKAFNATIGQITDGRGGALPLPAMAAALAGLSPMERNQAFLYSPVEGLASLRQRWRIWQRRGQPDERPSSLPLVTYGTAHARSLAFQFFTVEGRTVVLPEPCHPEDLDLLESRIGARVLPVQVHDGHFDPTALSRELPVQGDDPAVVLLDFPRPNGFMPMGKERSALRRALIEAADHRPLIVVVDDTWEQPEAPSASLFWGLIGRHPNLVPLKVDGADGPLGFPGGRVGFLTFPFDPDSGIAKALESKLKMVLRAQVGSPSAAAQAVLLAALGG